MVILRRGSVRIQKIRITEVEDLCDFFLKTSLARESSVGAKPTIIVELRSYSAELPENVSSWTRIPPTLRQFDVQLPFRPNGSLYDGLCVRRRSGKVVIGLWANSVMPLKD